MKRLLALVMLMAWLLPATAQEAFQISDIRVEGLQRITEGTVFNYLPVDPGDTLTAARSRTAIRELYRTGFFDDVSLGRDGTILVITVKERPAISSINLSGNKALKSEDLLGVLAENGLAEGETFNRVQLDRITQGLTQEYFNQGKYGVQLESTVTDLDRNRVRIGIDINEGDNAKIRHVNIVGNTVFDDKTLLDELESQTKSPLIFWSKADQYSAEKMEGDMETLTSYYQDRGYVDFAIESTQISISEDKEDIYITANVREGEVFTIDDFSLTGDLVVSADRLERLILTRPGDTFSRARIEGSVNNITAVLANSGYAFADVFPQPDINREDNTVKINYFVDPRKRVYIRRVVFVGNTKTKDEVLRREMRQFEGAWFSQNAIDRSRVRLQRLTYFDNVTVDTPAVPGTEDQVDVVVTVEERPSGSFSAGLGFSQVQGLIASLSISQDNFIGSGKRLGLGLSLSDILTQFDLNYTNPYSNEHGVSRGFFLRYREFDQAEANISTFTSSEAAAGVNYGIPVSEVDFIGFGISARQTDINIGNFFRELNFLDPDDPTNILCDDFDGDGICPEFYLVPIANDPLSRSLDANGDGQISDSERQFDTLQVDASWSRDSRDHFLNPNRGSIQRFAIEASLPGSSREYYKLFYKYQKYIPFWRSLVFSVKGDIGYGNAYDSYDEDIPFEAGTPVRLAGECNIADISALDTGLPFFEHFYGGGVRDIRGFEDNTLGPKDQFCRAIGGDLKVSGGVELAFPTPFLGGRGGSRLALFLDVGNVYEDLDAFETSTLRASTGVSVTWEAPIGPIVINFAVPLREQEGDDTESLQFSFGTSF